MKIIWVSSVGYALKGLRYAFAREPNFRFQIFIGAAVIFLAWFFHVQRLEWMIVFLCMGLVLCCELVNSAVEKLVDMVKPRLHDQAEAVKDIMAGAVFLSAGVAFGVGLGIFLPHVIEFLLHAWYNTMDF